MKTGVKIFSDRIEYYFDSVTLSIVSNGSKYWYQNDSLHREDGPAIELIDGTKEWWLNGHRHREDGPAVERSDGAKYWYKFGLWHREDGPAFENADGKKFWFLNGKRVKSPNET